MPDLELSALNTTDLRRLSSAARARGDGVLADQVDWEIAERTVRAAQAHGAVMRPADIETEGELEPEDVENDVEAGFAAVADVQIAEEDFPMDEDSAADAAFRADDEARVARSLAWIAVEDEAEPADAERGWAWRAAALVAVGVVGGAALTATGFWALAGTGQREAASRVVDVLTVPAPPAAGALPAPVAVAAAAPGRHVEAPPAPPHAARGARSATAAGTQASAKAGDGCAQFATTAERLVCSDPQFAGLAQRMVEARKRAIAAAPDDPRVKDESWWTRARAEAGDSTLLARLVERRIHELDTVAAQGGRDEPIF